MWCILCCHARAGDERKGARQEMPLPVGSKKPDVTEYTALIPPVDNDNNKNNDNMNVENHRDTAGPDVAARVPSALPVDKPIMRDNPVTMSNKEPTSLLTEKPLESIDEKSVPQSNQKSEQSNKTSIQKTHRPEGMTVSFNTPLEQEVPERPIVQPSATGRPIWTLKDVLDSPYHCEPVNDGKPDDLIISLLESKSAKTQSSDLITDNVKKCDAIEISDKVQLTRRHTRPGSFHHPHTTFFLPRISTDPSTTLDHNYPTDGKPFPIRRGSMIVRSGRTTASTTNVQSASTEQSSAGPPSAGVEGFIVTPFAQVLVSMQRIRSAFIRLTSTQSTNRFGVISSAVTEPGVADILVPQTTEYKTVASETLEELEWCLRQLENIQTKRPVSDMAFSKFKRLLNKELNSFGEADKSQHEISAYICGTFLEDEKDAQANQEIEQMLERRRSSGQSHTSSGTVQDGQALTPAAKAQQSQQQQQRAGSVKQSENLSDGPVPKVPSTTALTGTISTGKSSDSLTNIQNITSATGKVIAADSTQADKPDGTQTDLPLHGIKTSNDKELDDRFTQYLDTWGIDIFEVDRLSDGHGLVTTTYRIFQKRDLMRIFSIDPATLVRYLLKVEQNYHPDVPYHNSLHATDVIQTSHFLLQAEPLEDVFSDLEILAVLFASAVHDVDHPGLTNQYLINTGHDLALQYNDTSVLENHHLYVAFKLLNEPECDVFAALTTKKRQTLRRMVIELVLATDMSKHMSLLADLRTMVETKKVSGSGVLNLDNYADRIQILQNMIHCADLSNPAKPLRLNRKWTGRLMEEFFRQGDKERKLKLEISPMCDRESVAVEKSQVKFIDFVAHPLLESWCDLVHPSAQLILDTLADNRDWYESQVEGPRPSGATKGRPKLATAEEDEEEQAISS